MRLDCSINVIVQIPSMAVQILRLYAIWGKSRAVVAITMTTATLALISYTVVSVLSVKAISYTNNILGETFGCLVADGPGTNQGVVLATLTTSWSTATAFETLMLLLLIPRYLSHSRTPRRDLLGVLLRDGFSADCGHLQVC